MKETLIAIYLVLSTAVALLTIAGILAYEQKEKYKEILK